MTMQQDIVEHAIVATKSGGSVQETVRKVLVTQPEKEALSTVCGAMVEFRTTMEGWINSNDELVKDRRKRVNNVVNDVSRIVREGIGHSIVCKSRKGGYVYEAKEWTGAPKPAKTALPIKPAYSFGSIDEMSQFVSTHLPVRVLHDMLKQYTNEQFVEFVTQAKEALDTDRG